MPSTCRKTTILTCARSGQGLWSIHSMDGLGVAQTIGLLTRLCCRSTWNCWVQVSILCTGDDNRRGLYRDQRVLLHTAKWKSHVKKESQLLLPSSGCSWSNSPEMVWFCGVDPTGNKYWEDTFWSGVLGFNDAKIRTFLWHCHPPRARSPTASEWAPNKRTRDPKPSVEIVCTHKNLSESS